jgi:hypothetical protein
MAMPTREDFLEPIAIGIRRHEHFDRAVRMHVGGLLAWRGGLGGYNKVISSHARNFIMNSILYLHFQARPDDPDEGATYERLLKLCVDRGFCGPRVLRTVLMLGESTGRLTCERGRFDRRLKLFRPTEKLIAQARHCTDHMLSCFDILLGGKAPRHDAVSREATFRRMISVAGRRYFEDGLELSEHYGDLLALLRLDGGCATVLAVTDAQLAGVPLPAYKEVAARFRFSASQSRKILKRGEELGLVAFSAGRLTDASALVRTYQWAFARELALYAKYGLGLGSYFEQRAAERRPAAEVEVLNVPFAESGMPAWEQPRLLSA